MSFRLRLDHFGGPIATVALPSGQTLAGLQEFAVERFGLGEGPFSFFMTWPSMDPRYAIPEGHPALARPLSELALFRTQGLVLSQGGRVNVFVEAIEEGSGEGGPITEVAFEDPQPGLVAYRRLRAALRQREQVPPPAGIPEAPLAALVAALEANHELTERGYGRRPGGAPTAEAVVEAQVAALAAWIPLLDRRLDRDDRARLEAYLGPAHRPAARLLEAVLKYPWPDGPPPHVEDAVRRACIPLREGTDELIVVHHARSLLRSGLRQEAADLLRVHGVGSDDRPVWPGWIVTVGEALYDAGDHESARSRWEHVAGHVWMEHEEQARARSLITRRFPAADLGDAWTACDQLRESLLAES